MESSKKCIDTLIESMDLTAWVLVELIKEIRRDCKAKEESIVDVKKDVSIW